MGLGILASLGNVANASTTLNENITINYDSDIHQYFNPMDDQNIINYKNNCTTNCEGSVNITFGNRSPFWELSGKDEGNDKERVHINIDNADLTLMDDGSFITNFNFNAKDITATDIRLQSIYGQSYTDARNFTLTGTQKPTGSVYSDDDKAKIASILLVNGYDNFNGGLNIDDSDKGGKGEGGNFRVYEKADIKNSLFVIECNDVSKLDLGSEFTYINAGSFNTDITTSNEAKPFVRKTLSELPPNTDLSGAMYFQQGAFNATDTSVFAEYTLSVKKGDRELLIATSKLTDKVTDLKAILELDKAILNSKPDENLNAFKDEINKRKQEIDKKIAALGTSTGSGKDFIEILDQG